MLDAILWLVREMGMGFYNFFYAITHPGLWLSWVWNGLASTDDKKALMRFIYYGASRELFFVFLDFFLILTALGLWKRRVMWGTVIAYEKFANTLGRTAAWAGLIMVLQQTMVVFLQRIFRVSEIAIGPFSPFGYKLWDGFTLIAKDLSWWGEELKLYNAIIVTLCCAYTFIQGGHVRVDLVYARLRFRRKKLVDMVGSLLFMLPMMLLIWKYSWPFMWRHLITPAVSASDRLELMLRKAIVVRWNVETTGFSPSGFDAYFLFKVLLVAFTATMIMMAITYFYRSLLAFREGPEAETKYLDKDTLGEGEEVYEGTH